MGKRHVDAEQHIQFSDVEGKMDHRKKEMEALLAISYS